MSARVSACAFAVAALAFASAARADVTHPHPGTTLVTHPGESAMVIVDLCAPGVSLVATKYAERKKTVGEYGQALGLQAAMNADFFDFPGWTYVIGRARGQGEDWPPNAQQKEDRPYWQFGPFVAEGVAAGSTPPAPGVTEIVGGHNVIIAGGQTTGPWSDANDGQLLNTLHARSAIGSSADRRTLYMMSTTTAISASTLVTWLQAHAAEGGAPPVDWATNQDGGGSAQLYVAGLGEIISTGRQVNNHLGLRATGAGEPTMCNDRPPRGFLDAATCEAVVGWAQDENAPDAHIDVTLTFDGDLGAPGVASVVAAAGEHRDDLCGAIGSCEHGFTRATPFGLFDGAPHAVHAYGLDADGARDAELAQSPLTLTCPTPPLDGVLRHVVDPASYAAWGFVAFVDQLQVDDATLAALPISIDLPNAPALVRADDGSPEVWLVDGTASEVRRHVPDPQAAAAWHFDLGAVAVWPAADVDALLEGPALRPRPTLVKATGPAVYLLDDPLDGAGGAGGGAASGGGATVAASAAGAGGSGDASAPADEAGCACRAAPAPRSGLPAAAMLIIVAVARARFGRRRRS